MLPPFILSTVLILLCCLVFPKEQLSVPEAQVTVDSCRAVIYGGLFCLAVAMVLRLVPYVLGLTVIVLALWLLDRHALKTVDWGLLATFAAFFSPFPATLLEWKLSTYCSLAFLSHGTMLISALTCQIISNVPAAISAQPLHAGCLRASGWRQCGRCRNAGGFSGKPHYLSGNILTMFLMVENSSLFLFFWDQLCLFDDSFGCHVLPERMSLYCQHLWEKSLNNCVDVSCMSINNPF